jgi:hypothetical protein
VPVAPTTIGICSRRTRQPASCLASVKSMSTPHGGKGPHGFRKQPEVS